MLKESSNTQTKNTSPENKNIARETMICKDGFCSLPNQKAISKKDKNDINFFDPV